MNLYLNRAKGTGITMAIVYLCIGTMKTGTTALQNFMRNNPKALEKQGFCYPFMEVGPGPNPKNRNGNFLIYQSTQKDPQKKAKENEETRIAGYQKLQKLANDYSNIVLSEELLWHHCEKYENFWEDIVDNLKKINCQLKIVVYLRRQDELIQSLWNQGVKIGVRLSVSFQKYIRTKKYKYFPLDYYTHLKKIEQVVGRENLLIRIYENGQYEGEEQSIISDFTHTLGITLTDEFKQDSERRNPSLNGNFIEMKRLINGLPEYREMSDFIEKPILSACAFQESHSPKKKQSFFTYEQQTAFLSEYEESNRKVATEFLNREDGVLFRKPIEHLPVYQVDSDTMYRDLITFLGVMFCRQQQAIKKLEKKPTLRSWVSEITDAIKEKV